jgi:hypothetical protein
MINSVGPLNLNTIDRLSGHAGIISLTCQQLVEHITNIFGTLHPNDVFYLEASIKEQGRIAFLRRFPRLRRPQLSQLRHSRKDPAHHQQRHQDPIARELPTPIPSV